MAAVTIRRVMVVGMEKSRILLPEIQSTLVPPLMS